MFILSFFFSTSKLEMKNGSWIHWENKAANFDVERFPNAGWSVNDASNFFFSS